MIKSRLNTNISAQLFFGEDEFEKFTELKRIFNKASSDKSCEKTKEFVLPDYRVAEYSDGKSAILEEVSYFKSGEVRSVFYRLEVDK